MIISQSNIKQDHIKLRWEEPFVSASLNAKVFGVLPPGVYSGFRLVAEGRVVRVTAGDFGPLVWNYNSSYSIAVHHGSGGYSTTIVIPYAANNDLLLDCGETGGRRYVVLTTNYVVGVSTEAQIRLVDADYLLADPRALILGYVDVPASMSAAVTVGYDDLNHPRTVPLVDRARAGFMSPAMLGVQARSFVADAVVGTELQVYSYQATHSSLRAAIDSVPAGSVIRVITDQTIGDVTVSTPNLTISGGSVGTRILTGRLIISAANIRVSGLDFTQAATNAITLNSTGAQIVGCKFNTASQIVTGSGTYLLDNQYLDGSSQVDRTRLLARVSASCDAIVGSEAQVLSGAATHSSFAQAIAAIPVSGSVKILPGTYSENLTLSKACTVEGYGAGTVLTGDLVITANYSTVRGLKLKNLVLSASGCFVRDCFMAATGTVSDTGSANSKLIIKE